MKSGTELRPLFPFLPPLLSNLKVHTAPPPPPPSLRSKRKVEEDGKGGGRQVQGEEFLIPPPPPNFSLTFLFSFRLSPRIKKEKEKGEETTFSDLKIGRCCHGSREKEERGNVHGVIENGGGYTHTEHTRHFPRKNTTITLLVLSYMNSKEKNCSAVLSLPGRSGQGFFQAISRA